MKTSLLFHRSSVFVLFLCYFINTSGQTVIFSEDFSGFINGTHVLPSTTDASGSLDTKSQVPGWTGFKVYSAGGEIKLGTADMIGWIETPSINFTGYDGTLKVKFDICRWPSDATSVRVLQDGTQIGSTLTPGDNFETIERPLTAGVTSGKIRFEAVSKRFFLDNVSIISVNTPTDIHSSGEPAIPLIYPNPARDLLTVRNITGYKTIEVLDLSGKRLSYKELTGAETGELSLQDLSPGVYIVRLSSRGKIYTTRLIKMQ